MATKQGGKGKGRQTPAKALKRAMCWKRAQERHAANREAQNERAARNRALRVRGEWTPWERSKARRRSWINAGFKGSAGPLVGPPLNQLHLDLPGRSLLEKLS